MNLQPKLSRASSSIMLAMLTVLTMPMTVAIGIMLLPLMLLPFFVILVRLNVLSPSIA